MHSTEFEKLQDFLGTPPETYDPENLQEKILKKVQTFYAAELLESGEPSNELEAPSGPENAQLGLVKHCPSKEGKIREFWNTENRSIQTLAKKGLAKSSCSALIGIGEGRVLPVEGASAQLRNGLKPYRTFIIYRLAVCWKFCLCHYL